MHVNTRSRGESFSTQNAPETPPGPAEGAHGARQTLQLKLGRDCRDREGTKGVRVREGRKGTWKEEEGGERERGEGEGNGQGIPYTGSSFFTPPALKTHMLSIDDYPT